MYIERRGREREREREREKKKKRQRDTCPWPQVNYRALWPRGGRLCTSGHCGNLNRATARAPAVGTCIRARVVYTHFCLQTWYRICVLIFVYMQLQAFRGIYMSSTWARSTLQGLAVAR